MSAELAVETAVVESTESAPLAAAVERGRSRSADETLGAELAGVKRDLAEALDEVTRLGALNSALKNQVAELQDKLASRGGSRGPSQPILDRQNRCRPRFLQAAAESGGTNAAELVAEGLSLKDKGWQLNDIYAVAAQAEAAGQVVKRSKGRKAFWFTPEVLAAMENQQAAAGVEEAAKQDDAVPEADVVIDL